MSSFGRSRTDIWNDIQSHQRISHASQRPRLQGDMFPANLYEQSSRKWESDEHHHHHHHLGHFSQLGEHAADLWKHNSITNVTIVVAGVPFQAHQTILTCYSPFFARTLLKPGSGHMQNITVRLSDVHPDAFRVLLNHMYTGELDLCCQTIGDVYQGARKLEMSPVVEKCAKILSGKDKSLEGVLFRYVTARQMGLEEPHRKALAVILDKLEDIVLTKEFLHLKSDELIEIMSQDTIGARSELVVFLAILKWLQYDLSSRASNSTDLLSCVRFPMMELEEVLCCHYPPLLPHLVQEPVVRNMLLKGICYAAAKSCRLESYFQQYASQTRTYTRTGEPLILWDISKYDSSYRSPSVMHLAASRIQRYVRGHLTRLKYRKRLEERHRAATKLQAHWRAVITRMALKDWTHVSQIPSGYSYQTDLLTVDPCLHSLLYHNRSQPSRDRLACHFPLRDLPATTDPFWPKGGSQTVVIVGGINPAFPEDVHAVGQMILRLNHDTKCWEKMGTIPLPRHHHCLACVDRFLYVIGGCDPRLTYRDHMVATRDVLRLDLASGRWSRVKPMLEARVYHGVAVISGVIYVVGGKDETGNLLSSVEFYDPSADVWCHLGRPLCCPRSAAGVAEHRGLLWVAGGIIRPPRESRAYVIRDVECYDPVSNRWLFTKSRIPRHRAYGKLVSTDGHLILVGGCEQSEKDARNLKPAELGVRGPELHHWDRREGQLSSVAETLCYDESTNQWTECGPSVLEPRHDVAVAAFGRAFVCAGGLSTETHTALRDVICYDTQMRGWSALQPLPFPTTGSALVTLPGTF